MSIHMMADLANVEDTGSISEAKASQIHCDMDDDTIIVGNGDDGEEEDGDSWVEGIAAPSPLTWM